MNRHISSVLAFTSSVAAATLAATVMAGNAFADDITIDNTPFVSQRTRAEVQADLFSQRDQFNGSNEWASQHNPPQQYASGYAGYTRAQARSDYIGSREQVRAMNGEDSGSAMLAHSRSNGAGSSVVMTKSSH